MPACMKRCNSGKKKYFEDGYYTYTELVDKNFVFTTITRILLFRNTSIAFQERGIPIYSFTNTFGKDYEVSVCIRIGRTTTMQISSIT